MFGEMTAAIAKDTVRLLFNVRLEQKVEREQVAKVTGTNKDDSAAHTPVKREEKKVYQMILVRVEVVRNTNSAVAAKHRRNKRNFSAGSFLPWREKFSLI